MELNTGVYAVLNEVNGKVYVGSTARGFEQRWRQHKQSNSTCRALKSALKKYGVENFSFHILEPISVAGLPLGDARKILIDAEQRWIDLVNPFGENGYNMLPKAYSHLGAKRSDATKAALSRSLKGKKHPLERIEKNRQVQLGKKQSEETKEKRRQAMLGRVSPMKGRTHSEETKRKIRENGKGLHRGPLSAEHRAKLSLAHMGLSPANKGKPMPEHVKEILRKANAGRPSPRKGVHLSEEEKEKIRQRVTGFKHTIEAREKIRAAALRQWQRQKSI